MIIEDDYSVPHNGDKLINVNKKVKKTKYTERLLKPHGVATWLFNHYPKLTVVQISKFCGLDELKVGFLKTELNNGKMYAMSNPILMGYVTKESLAASSENPHLPIVFIGDDTLKVIMNTKKRKYISFKERKDKLSVALWLINYYKNLELTPEDVKSLTGASIVSIKKIFADRKYASSITPLDPIKSNICTRQDIEKIISKYNTNTLK